MKIFEENTKCLQINCVHLLGEFDKFGLFLYRSLRLPCQ